MGRWKRKIYGWMLIEGSRWAEGRGDQIDIEVMQKETKTKKRKAPAAPKAAPAAKRKTTAAAKTSKATSTVSKDEQNPAEEK